MKPKFMLQVGLVILSVLLVTGLAWAYEDEGETGPILARIRRATVKFHRVEAAQAAGYALLPGLDHCFDNPGWAGWASTTSTRTALTSP